MCVRACVHKELVKMHTDRLCVCLTVTYHAYIWQNAQGLLLAISCFSAIVASLMVADVISPTLSRTNSPTPQHNNDYPFTLFNNYTILNITRKIPCIHTHDLTKSYTRRTLIKSFTKNTLRHFRTMENNNMIRARPVSYTHLTLPTKVNV